MELLTNYQARLSMLVHDFPVIREIDLNPFKGTGRDLYIVDCRILVDNPTDLQLPELLVIIFSRIDASGGKEIIENQQYSTVYGEN